MPSHNLSKFPKPLGAARKRFCFPVLAQAAHILGDILQRITLANADEQIPIQAEVQAFIQVANLLERALSKINRLLENIIAKVNELPKVERFGGWKAPGHLSSFID